MEKIKLLILEPLVTAAENGLSIGEEIFIQSKGVFSHISQAEHFEKVALPLVKSALRGINSTILTTGGAHSGKTYSLFGRWDQRHEIGLVPRLAEELFRFFDSKTQIFFSSFEVTSSDRIFDLLQKGQEGDVMLGPVKNN